MIHQGYPSGIYSLPVVAMGQEVKENLPNGTQVVKHIYRLFSAYILSKMKKIVFGPTINFPSKE